MKPRNLIATALFALLFAAATTSKAQIGVYAGFSGARLNSSNTNVYGPLVGVYAQSGHFLAIGADVRGSFLSRNGNQFYTGALGPRIAFKPIILPIKPYGEALVGVASFNNGGGSNSTNFNYQLLAGVDTTILPRLDWRIIEFDYSATTGNNSINAKILTTGLVFRLP
jgi:hypothetical protein